MKFRPPFCVASSGVQGGRGRCAALVALSAVGGGAGMPTDQAGTTSRNFNELSWQAQQLIEERAAGPAGPDDRSRSCRPRPRVNAGDLAALQAATPSSTVSGVQSTPSPAAVYMGGRADGTFLAVPT